jgi:transposase
MVRTGCQWRNLPPCYPPWRAVNYYFEQWTHSAGEHDGAAACPLIEACSAIRQRLPKILGDGAYANTFAQNAEKARIEPERASKPEAVKGFVPIPKRWVVERTIAWTNFFRRLVKDYEYTVSSAESWVLLAKTTLMLQRLLIKNHP